MARFGRLLPDSTQFPRAALPAALLLCFAIAASLGLYALSYLRTVLVHERGDHLTRTASAVSNILDRVLFERFSDIQLLAKESVLYEGTPEEKRARLMEYQRLYRYYSWLALTDRSGRLIASTSGLPAKDQAATVPDWHSAVLDKAVHLIEAHSSAESDGDIAVGFAAPIYDEANTFQGVVTSRVPFVHLEPIMEQESRLREGGRDFYEWLLLDREGAIIVESHPTASPGSTYKLALRSSAEAMRNPEPGFVEEMNQRRQVPVLTGYARTKGYENFPGFEWIVLVLLDREHAYAPINRLLWTVGGIGVLLLVPLTGYGVWSSWRLGQEHRQLALARQHLEESVKELSRSNAELQQFAYVASHDLQEPLRMVSSYTQLLAKRYKGKLDADADDFIGFAVDGASRMQKLIQDLLSYSRASTRSIEPERVPTEAALTAATDNLRIAVKESGAVITHDPLPTLTVDERQLTQLFQNLLSNAMKFRGHESPRVHVSAKRLDAEWVFSVQDNGIGIDRQYADRIFVIFQRLHNREQYPGTGIGLAICRRIVERHGGRMWMESEPGKGATFFFTLPAEESRKAAHGTETE